MRIREALKHTNPSDPDPQFHAFNPDQQYREKRLEDLERKVFSWRMSLSSEAVMNRRPEFALA
jgi:hypothetical protein